MALTNFDALYTGGIGKPDFESILPQVMANYIPVGLLGLLVAGLFAAFMSNFAATVNSAPAYIVNDIYKRYINPAADDKKYVRLSYTASIAIVIIGIVFGFVVESINEVMLWITAALWGGYVVSNILKWYWWRFNGYGYFWGMVAGIGTSLVMPLMIKFGMLGFLNNWPLPNNISMNSFPFIFISSIIGCLVATLITKPEEDETLMAFYKNVRPWGFWKPVHEKVMRVDPDFKQNKNFKRDMFNIVTGICWQITLMATPVYIILREWKIVGILVLILIVTSVILKRTWYNTLED